MCNKLNHHNDTKLIFHRGFIFSVTVKMEILSAFFRKFSKLSKVFLCENEKPEQFSPKLNYKN